MQIETYIRCDRCGAQVAREVALEALYDETVYYFCSARCREEKDYAPGRDDVPEEEEAAAEGS